MHPASQQDLCLKLRQLVRHLQLLLTERDKDSTALAEELRLAKVQLSELETELRGTKETADRAESRAQQLESDLKALQDELNLRDAAGDAMTELQVALSSLLSYACACVVEVAFCAYFGRHRSMAAPLSPGTLTT